MNYSYAEIKKDNKVEQFPGPYEKNAHNRLVSSKIYKLSVDVFINTNQSFCLITFTWLYTGMQLPDLYFDILELPPGYIHFYMFHIILLS